MHVLNTAPRPVARTQALSADTEIPVLGLDLALAEHEQAVTEMLAQLKDLQARSEAADFVDLYTDVPNGARTSHAGASSSAIAAPNGAALGERALAGEAGAADAPPLAPTAVLLAD